jgi:hypothetical protein
LCLRKRLSFSDSNPAMPPRPDDVSLTSSRQTWVAPVTIYGIFVIGAKTDVSKSTARKSGADSVIAMDLDDTFEQQEERARSRLRPSAILATWVFVGILFQPWITVGPDRLAGRYFSLMDWSSLFLHYGVMFAYCIIVGACVYRLNILLAFLAAPFIGIGLYFLNLIVTHAVASPSPNEGAIVILHIIFALFATACYKGFSVPRIRLRYAH